MKRIPTYLSLTEVPVPQPRVHCAGVAIGDEIYLIGGEYHHNHDCDAPTVQIYDTVANTWSSGPDLPRGRSHHEWATFVHNGLVWCVSGVDSSQSPRGHPLGDR
ncbi:kelch repeat-containing protein [Verrucomicrobiota bacterium]